MGFDLIYWTQMGGSYFLVDIFGKTTDFTGGYGWVGDIPHGPTRPDWGL